MTLDPARPRQLRAERTRSLIIETAARAFGTHGFDGVSLNDLIAASGMSKGAFYFHFSSKEEVALAAFRTKQQELADKLATARIDGSVVDQVRQSLRRRAEFVTEDPSLRCVIRLGSDLTPRSGPESEYASFQALGVSRVTALVERGIQSGEFGSHIEPAAVGEAIFSWLVGMDSLSLLGSDAKDLSKRTEVVLDLLIAALTAPAPRQDATRNPKAVLPPKKRPNTKDTKARKR